MKKLFLIVVSVPLFISLLWFCIAARLMMCLVDAYAQMRYEARINRIDEKDTIIALKPNSSALAYRFILTDDGRLIAAYGWHKYERGSFGNIVSRDFMETVEIEETVFLPQEVTDEIFMRIDAFIAEKGSTDIMLVRGGWSLFVLNEDGIFRNLWLSGDENETILVDLLSEWSPIVVELGHNGGVAELKNPE